MCVIFLRNAFSALLVLYKNQQLFFHDILLILSILWILISHQLYGFQIFSTIGGLLCPFVPSTIGCNPICHIFLVCVKSCASESYCQGQWCGASTCGFFWWICTFRSLIHFELIFVNSMRWKSNFFPLHVAIIYFPQHHLLGECLSQWYAASILVVNMLGYSLALFCSYFLSKLFYGKKGGRVLYHHKHVGRSNWNAD